MESHTDKHEEANVHASYISCITAYTRQYLSTMHPQYGIYITAAPFNINKITAAVLRVTIMHVTPTAYTTNILTFNPNKK
jgi:hypothetical protein